MNFGTVLRQLQEQGSAAEALTAISDLVLFARVCEVAERFAETPSDYMAASVTRFANGADEAAWTGLIGAMERAANPSSVAFERMVRWALEIDSDNTDGRRCEGGLEGCACYDSR